MSLYGSITIAAYRGYTPSNSYIQHTREYNSAMAIASMGEDTNRHLEMVHIVSGYTATPLSHRYIQPRQIKHDMDNLWINMD
jgi:hypothetical protein